MAPPVRLQVEGSRMLLDPNITLQDARQVAAGRLNCAPADVVLRVKDPDGDATAGGNEEDDMWEVEGEGVFQEAAANKQMVYASRRPGASGTRKRRMSASSAGTGRLDASRGNGKSRKGEGALSRASSATSQQAQQDRPPSTSARASHEYARAPSETSAGSASGADQKSSGKAWQHADLQTLWDSFVKLSKTMPTIHKFSIYSVAERHSLVERVMAKNARICQGRTVTAIDSQLRTRARIERGRGVKLSPKVEALYPISRHAREEQGLPLRQEDVNAIATGSRVTVDALRALDRAQQSASARGAAPLASPRKRRYKDHNGDRHYYANNGATLRAVSGTTPEPDSDPVTSPSIAHALSSSSSSSATDSSEEEERGLSAEPGRRENEPAEVEVPLPAVYAMQDHHRAQTSTSQSDELIRHSDSAAQLADGASAIVTKGQSARLAPDQLLPAQLLAQEDRDQDRGSEHRVTIKRSGSTPAEERSNGETRATLSLSGGFAGNIHQTGGNVPLRPDDESAADARATSRAQAQSLTTRARDRSQSPRVKQHTSSPEGDFVDRSESMQGSRPSIRQIAEAAFAKRQQAAQERRGVDDCAWAVDLRSQLVESGYWQHDDFTSQSQRGFFSLISALWRRYMDDVRALNLTVLQTAIRVTKFFDELASSLYARTSKRARFACHLSLFAHHFVFSERTTDTLQLFCYFVAACTYFLPTPGYSSFLECFLDNEWSSELRVRVPAPTYGRGPTAAASRQHLLHSSTSEHVFARMDILLWALNSLRHDISRLPIELAAAQDCMQQNQDVPRFRHRAFQRFFVEANCEEPHKWTRPDLFEHVHVAMMEWNRVCGTFSSEPSPPRSRHQRPQRTLPRKPSNGNTTDGHEGQAARQIEAPRGPASFPNAIEVQPRHMSRTSIAEPTDDVPNEAESSAAAAAAAALPRTRETDPSLFFAPNDSQISTMPATQT